MKIIIYVFLFFLISCSSGEEEAFRLSSWVKEPLPNNFENYPEKIKWNWHHYKVGNPYQVQGAWYRPEEDPGYNETGLASWYGPNFNKRPTANGELFDKDLVSAAHRTLPMPSIVRVKNLENGRVIKVRVNDRGPYVDIDKRIIDLSEAAAKKLGFRKKGTARVRVSFDKKATAKLFHPDGQRVKVKRIKPSINSPNASNNSYNRLKNSGNNDYYIQAGAYSSKWNAYKQAGSLRRIYRSSVEEVERMGSLLYRVRLGPFDNMQTADMVLNKIKKAGYSNATIVAD